MTIFYGWWIVLASFLNGMFIAGTVFYSFTAFMEPLASEFGWSYTQLSIATSLRGLEMGLFAPLVGVLVDRFGPRLIIFVGMVIVGLGMILLSVTNSLLTFYIAFLLLGFGAGGCTSVVIMTAVASWFKERISLALGLAASGFGFGGFLVPLVVYMIDHLQWRKTLLIFGIAAWLVGIALSFVFRGKPEKYGLLPDGAKIEESDLDPNGDEDITFMDAMRDSNFWYLNIGEGIRMMIVMSIILHVMPYLGSLGISRTTAGMATGGLAVFSIIGRIGFGYIGDVFSKKNVMVASYILMTIGLFLFANFITGTISLLIFLLVFAPGFGGAMIMRGSILREYFGSASYGKILGITMGVGSVAGIIGPVLAGWVFDNLETYYPIWVVFIALNVVATLMIARMKPIQP
ncbi:MAG: MFS transporter [Deltaproteobacteria bacterium]|nr:MFS transporter [Deltaproteobacteria bacterium]